MLGMSSVAARIVIPGLVGLIVLAASTSPARADRIDGQWCSPDGKQSLQIDGPDIVTPGGNHAHGEYGRHSFVYTVPDSEPDAGATVSMIQLHDRAINHQVGEGDVETWTRCQHVS